MYYTCGIAMQPRLALSLQSFLHLLSTITFVCHVILRRLLVFIVFICKMGVIIFTGEDRMTQCVQNSPISSKELPGCLKLDQQTKHPRPGCAHSVFSLACLQLETSASGTAQVRGKVPMRRKCNNVIIAPGLGLKSMSLHDKGSPVGFGKGGQGGWGPCLLAPFWPSPGLSWPHSPEPC